MVFDATMIWTLVVAFIVILMPAIYKHIIKPAKSFFEWRRERERLRVIRMNGIMQQKEGG